MDNVTVIRPPAEPPQPAASLPVLPVYFEHPEGEPSILSLLQALEGVCSALDAEQITFDDHEQMERIGGLSTAASILARQLSGRWTSKPLTKKQLEAARKHQADWAKLKQQAATD
jgi:hypothetical protein